MPYKLSPSSLSLLKECPRCFWLRFRKDINRPSTIFPSLPSGMDRILKTHFDSFMEKGLLPPELEKLNGEVRLFNDKELLKTWRDNRKGIQWADDEGNLLRGAVDNILQKKDKLIVLDYKTRGYPVKEDTHSYYNNQLDIYNFLLRKNDYKTEDYSYLLFYHPNKVDPDGDVLFHTDLIRVDVSISNAQAIFDRALEVLGGAMPKSHKDCGFCGWAGQCKPF